MVSGLGVSDIERCAQANESVIRPSWLQRRRLVGASAAGVGEAGGVDPSAAAGAGAASGVDLGSSSNNNSKNNISSNNNNSSSSSSSSNSNNRGLGICLVYRGRSFALAPPGGTGLACYGQGLIPAATAAVAWWQQRRVRLTAGCRRGWRTSWSATAIASVFETFLFLGQCFLLLVMVRARLIG